MSESKGTRYKVLLSDKKAGPFDLHFLFLGIPTGISMGNSSIWHESSSITMEVCNKCLMNHAGNVVLLYLLVPNVLNSRHLSNTSALFAEGIHWSNFIEACFYGVEKFQTQAPLVTRRLTK